MDNKPHEHTATPLERITLTFQRYQCGGIQMKADELSLILSALKKYPHPKFLVFGFGYDTAFWLNKNKDGHTVFLEDNEDWYKKVIAKFPNAHAHLVTYPNDTTMWRELLNTPEKLEMTLPDEVMNTKWDVILVDAPAGWKESPALPGRMSSIYMASKLVTVGGEVFIHDCDRKIEATYGDTFFGNENLIAIAKGRSVLRMYKKKT